MSAGEGERRTGGAGRVRRFERRLYARILDPDARRQPSPSEPGGSFEHNLDASYCLLTTFKRDGTAVPTPVWFALHERALYVRSDAQAGKVKRIRRDSRVSVAPCTARGKPTGKAVAGRARILPATESAPAEAALTRRYGLGRRIYKLLSGSDDRVYIEVRPLALPETHS
jgi:PPOX class probable F420-dependent enzyme